MRCFLILVLLLGITSIAFAAPPERKFTLKEYLGHSWTNELVHYEVAFAAGECWPQSIQLLNSNNAPVPVQLSNVTLHPGGSIAKATVWFLVSLSPNGTQTFTFSGSAKHGKPPKLTTDLALVKEAHTAILATSNLAVRVLDDTLCYYQPQPTTEVPAPLQALCLRNGVWTGRGWLRTRLRCTGYTATVTDDGPVFKKIVIRYAFVTPANWTRATAPFYEMSIRMAAGQEIAYITEEYNLGDPTVYQEPQFHNEKEAMLWGNWAPRSHEAPENFCFSLYGAFHPTYARTISYAVSPEKGASSNACSENEYPLSFAKNRLEFTLTPWSRELPDQSMIYTVYQKGDPHSDIVSILPCMAGRWRNPDMLPHDSKQVTQYTDTNDIRIYSSSRPDLYLCAPLSLGRREWAIAVLHNPGILTNACDYTTDAKLLRKYGAYPLDKVKDWQLEWPETAYYPHLSTAPSNTGAEQARLNALQTSSEAVQKVYKAFLTELDRAIAVAMDWPSGGDRTDLDHFPLTMMADAEKADQLLAATALTADQRKALRARVAFLGYLLWDDEYLPSRKAGYGWGTAEMPLHVYEGRAMVTALLADHPMAKQWAAASTQFFTYALEGYFSADGSPRACPHYMNEEGIALFSAFNGLTNSGLSADLVKSLPHFRQFARFTIDMMPPIDLRFQQRIIPTEGESCWEGNQLAVPLAGLLQKSDPQLARELLGIALSSGASPESIRALSPNLTPVVPQLNSVAYPGYGAFLRSGAGSSAESYLQVRFGNFTIDHTNNDGGAFTWYARGVPLSVDFATMNSPRISSPWWHNALSFNHVEHDPPLACPGRDLPGCFYTGKGWVEHRVEPHTALAPVPDDTMSNPAEVFGHIATYAMQPGADYLCGEAERRSFVKLPYYTRENGDPDPWTSRAGCEQVTLAHPFQWTRQMLFVKDDTPEGPNYLYVTDDLRGNSELEPAFNFWCLATNVVQNRRQLFLNGQFGIDLDMVVVEPASGRIQIGEWGHHQTHLVGGSGLNENQKLVRVFGNTDGGGFRILFYPREANEPMPRVDSLEHGALVRVMLPDQTHWLLLSKTPITVTDGPVKLTGTAAVVKRWQDGRIRLILLAPGKVECAGKVLESAQPSSEDH